MTEPRLQLVLKEIGRRAPDHGIVWKKKADCLTYHVIVEWAFPDGTTQELPFFHEDDPNRYL